MLLKMRVRIFPSFWYQMPLFRVLAHELFDIARATVAFSRFHQPILRRPCSFLPYTTCSQEEILLFLRYDFTF